MTSLAREIGRAAASFETSARLEEFWRCVLFLMQVEAGHGFNNEKSARAAGLSPTGIEFVTKAAVPAGSMGDPNWSALAPHALVTEFFASLVGASVFDSVRGSTVQVPPRSTVVTLSSSPFIGSAIAEGGVKPFSKLTISSADVDPTKVTALYGLSKETVRMGGVLAQNMVRQELTKDLIRKTDFQFLSMIGSGALAIPSSGQTMSAIKSDISQLLQNVATGAGSRLFLVTTSVTAKAWSITPDAGAQPGFVGMTYRGGEISGIQVLVSDVVTPGEVWLLDATGLATTSDDDAARITASDKALVNMSDAPDSPPTSSTNMVSLWQMNLVGALAERAFGAKAVRSNSVAKVVNAFYSGSSPS